MIIHRERTPGWSLQQSLQLLYHRWWKSESVCGSYIMRMSSANRLWSNASGFSVIAFGGLAITKCKTHANWCLECCRAAPCNSHYGIARAKQNAERIEGASDSGIYTLDAASINWWNSHLEFHWASCTESPRQFGKQRESHYVMAAAFIVCTRNMYARASAWRGGGWVDCLLPPFASWCVCFAAKDYSQTSILTAKPFRTLTTDRPWW